MLFCGIVGMNTVIPVMMANRAAFYREQQERMYDPLFYEIALGIVEVGFFLFHLICKMTLLLRFHIWLCRHYYLRYLSSSSSALMVTALMTRRQSFSGIGFIKVILISSHEIFFLKDLKH
jgi:hypothetical protein